MTTEEAKQFLIEKGPEKPHSTDVKKHFPKPTPGPLAALGQKIRSINQANGWPVPSLRPRAQEFKVPAYLALIHSEVSEALEGFRHDDRANFAEEMADILIRVLDLASIGIDLDAEVERKLVINATRGHRHGGKKC